MLIEKPKMKFSSMSNNFQIVKLDIFEFLFLLYIEMKKFFISELQLKGRIYKSNFMLNEMYYS